MELDKYLTEASAEQTAEKNINRLSQEINSHIKKMLNYVRKGDYVKANSEYRDMKFKTNNMETYIRVLNK